MLAEPFRIGCDCSGPEAERLEPDAAIDSGETDGGGFMFDAGNDDAGGTDAGTDAGADAGTDAGADAGTDAGADAGFDGGVDAGSIDGGALCMLVRSVSAVPGTSMPQVESNTPNPSKTISIVAGNLLVAVAYGGQGPGGGGTPTLSTAPNMTFGVSDTAMNTWHAAPLVENGMSHHSAIQIFFTSALT